VPVVLEVLGVWELGVLLVPDWVSLPVEPDCDPLPAVEPDCAATLTANAHAMARLDAVVTTRFMW
jgi:hypothetical protein